MNKLSILILFLLPLNLFGQTWQKTVKFLDSKGSIVKEYPTQVTAVEFKVYPDQKQCQILYVTIAGKSTHTPMISNNMVLQKNGQQFYHWNGTFIQSTLKINFSKTGDILLAEYRETYRGNSGKIVIFEKVQSNVNSK